MIWYLGYGSNLNRARFACYVEGGTPSGAGRTYAGCRDRTPPRETTALTVPGRLTFAGESTVWGGGMAFLDPGGDSEVHGRAYLVTEEQLADVAEQEPRYDSADGGRRARRAARRGAHAQCPSRARRPRRGVPADDPRRPDRRRPDARRAVDYLLAAPGVDLLWDRASIEALEHPPDARG